MGAVTLSSSRSAFRAVGGLILSTLLVQSVCTAAEEAEADHRAAAAALEYAELCWQEEAARWPRIWGGLCS